MISRPLLIACSLSLLCSGCTLQDLMSGKPGSDSHDSISSAPHDSQQVPAPSLEGETTEPPAEDGLRDYDLMRLSDRFRHVAEMMHERRTLQTEVERLERLTRLNIMTEFYAFARDTRGLTSDADRTAFATRAAEQGAPVFAIYKYNYTFAKDALRLPTDTARHDFALARGRIQYPLQDAVLFAHSYALARDLRGLTGAEDRLQFARWIEDLPKSIKYLALYEEAYIYARDVRRLPTDGERHGFAVTEADSQVDAL